MTVAFVAHAALPLTKTTRVATCVRMGPKRADGSEVPAARPRGLFGKLRDAVLRPIVSVPGSEGRGDLLDCVFCKSTGRNDCEGCAGCGTDALGKCLMCDGRGMLTCTVCEGVGIVDRVRRGGTDDRNEYVVRQPSRKK